VVQSSKPIVVPRVSREPMFLRRTSERPELATHELSYVCVPILLNRKAVGALGVDFRFKPERDFDRTVKFLGVVASLLAQAIRIQRVIDAERDRLREENTHLKLELRERYDFSNILGTSGPMRLVYADWLEENGQDLHADYLRRYGTPVERAERIRTCAEAPPG
jgi:Nif-specific regulatory protein